MADKDIFGDDLSDHDQKELDNYRQEVANYNELVTRVFSSEDGEKLLEKWTKDILFSPIVVAGQSVEAHGIREGKAELVRTIHGIKELVNSNYHLTGE